jgi:hypothetical protein
VDDHAWRFVDRGHPSASGPAAAALRRGRDGQPLDRAPRVPAVRDRLAALTRSVRRAGSPRRSNRRDDPVIVGRGLGRDRPGRALLEDGPASGSGARTTSGRRSSGRPRRRLDRDQFLEIAETLDATSRLATSLADERRPLLRDLGASCTAAGVRSTLARSFDPVGELLDTASPRLGGLRAAVRVAYDRLRGGSTRSSARSSAALSRSRSSRSATGAT